MANELTVFIIGNTVYCHLTTTTLAGASKTPTTSVKIGIVYEDGTEKVADTTDMTEDATGDHSYYADTSGWSAGWYTVTATSIDGSGEDAKTNIVDCSFRLR
jgi:hypothetical protein